jgi:ABC-type Fe3+-siderophore transport system permease subunit
MKGSASAATSFVAVPCATFVGALCTAFAVYFFTTRKGRTPLTTLLLVGIAVNSVLASLTSLILSLSPDLVISHIMRLIVGPDHRLLLPAAALGGAIFLVWCDLLARTLAPTEELRLEIITAFVGGPFFLHLLLREEKRQQGRL